MRTFTLLAHLPILGVLTPVEPEAKLLGLLPRGWLRGVDSNHRPLGYEPNELPDCSTPQNHTSSGPRHWQENSFGAGDSSPGLPPEGRHRTIMLAVGRHYE